MNLLNSEQIKYLALNIPQQLVRMENIFGLVYIYTAKS